jgi:hypothetical protein
MSFWSFWSLSYYINIDIDSWNTVLRLMLCCFAALLLLCCCAAALLPCCPAALLLCCCLLLWELSAATNDGPAVR